MAVFMTRGVSLATWDGLGTLERETAIYRALAPRVGGVAFITYGDAADQCYGERLGGMEVHPNRRGLPARAYAQAIPLVHGRVLRAASVLKTNQVYGGIAALRSARIYRKPLVARCGFLWSEVADNEDGPRSLRGRFVASRERRLFRGADAVIVTTARLKERVRERHGVPDARITVIPNYVEIDRFAPRPETAEPGALAFIGRLAPEKNLAALIEALAGLDGVSLTLAGDGPQRAELERLAAHRGVDARFAGRVPNERLPELLARAEAFVLPSLYEGHPKALVEAMACGLPVIGTDVQGIREVVRHGETGVLCGTTPEDLRGAVEAVLGDPGLRERLGAAAREAAADVSLERVVELEAEVLERAMRR